MIEDADYLVMESTYGDRLHVGTHDKAKVFLDIVSETLDNGGTVVIPHLLLEELKKFYMN